MENFYFRDKTVEAKEIIGKSSQISEIWRFKYAPSETIGNCSDLFRKLKPKDEKDFCDKYFKYAEEHTRLKIRDRGLTFEEFDTLVKNYMEDGNNVSKIKYDYETYFNDALCHIITETFDGKRMEVDFMNFLRDLGYECDYFDGDIDAKYGVDIKVTRKDGKISAIQIKPISFFMSNRSDVHKDRIGLVKKYHYCLNDLGIKTYYAIYSKDRKTGNVTWLKNGDGFRFKINELFNYDINNIGFTIQRIMLKENYDILEK